jgi:MSHA biogenesis protein MshP
MAPPRRKAARAGSKQRGFAAVLAIILVVVLALMGVIMVTLSGGQALGAALSQREIQAWFAAQSALEAGIYNMVRSHNCAGGTVALPAPLTPYNATLTATAFASISEGSNTYNLCRLQATATSGNPADYDYVSRAVRATVTDD